MRTTLLFVLIAIGLSPAAVLAQSEDEQSAANKALDSTATQWSFQFAYQGMPDYHQDTLDSGHRPARHLSRQ